MRQIEFRAWDLKKSVMLEEFAIYTSESLGMSYDDARQFYEEDEIEDDSGHLSNGDDWVFILNDFILLQFTGLEDNYHRPIYENDILKSGQGNLFQVLWDENEAGWILNCLTGEFRGPCELKKHMEENLEIIGNIYENPELLKS